MTHVTADMSRMAPYSQEAEECLIGSVLIHAQTYLDIYDLVKADDFFILRNRLVWEAVDRLHQRGDVIEYVTIVNELRATGKLEMVGSSSYLGYLVSHAATWVHADVYAQLVRRTALRRRLIEAGNSISLLARSEELDIHEVMSRAEAILFEVTERNHRQEIEHIADVASDWMLLLEDAYRNRDKPLGVPSGFNHLDEILGGFQKSDLLILAARPGMGKTSLMLNVALQAAQNNAHVAFFSLEMSNEQLLQRLIASETGISSQKLRMAQFLDEDWKRIYYATDGISATKLYLDDTPALSIAQLRSKCRRLAYEKKLDLVCVDYLQLMVGAENNRNENRVQEISYISRGLKEIAREFYVPIIAGSQLSRAVEQRVDKRPVLSDLRESGSIEQDADIVMFIYRDDVYNESSAHPNEADIIVAKHRNGPTGTAVLYFNKELTKFQNVEVMEFDLEGI